MWHTSSEQSRGTALDARSDVFSLALVTLVTCTLIDGVHPLAGHADVVERIVALRDGRLSPRPTSPRRSIACCAWRSPTTRTTARVRLRLAMRSPTPRTARVPYGRHVIAAMLGSLPKTSHSADRD